MKSTFANISDEKQRAVINAAFKEFSAFGYREASTNRLVKSLGISKGSLFKYFDGKLDLYEHLLSLSVEHLLSFMKDFHPPADSDPVQGILSYAEMEFEYLIQYPTMYLFFFRLQQDLGLPELAGIKASLNTRAVGINHELLNKLGIPDAADFRNHLILVIAAYNQMFMENMKADTDWSLHKGAFLEGLRIHLDFIRWPLNGEEGE